MRYTSLSQLENKFLTTGNNGEYNLKKIEVPVPGENLTLHGQFCTPAGRTGYYHAVAHPKQRILLHFTAGQIRSDMSALTRQDFHVSVPFVIGRNGVIYQLYSSKFWSGNIGKGLGNANNAEDKKTISIEISNYAFLTEKNGNLETIYSRLKDNQGRTGPVDIYCSLSETEAYLKLNTPFRGQEFYATFTNEQYESLIVLLRYLTATYNIPREFLPEAKLFLPTTEVLNFKGIVTHVNYRETGKWDIGPAFDWNRVIQGLQAATFEPTLAKDRDMPDEHVIRSEAELETLAPATKGLQETVDELPDIDSTAIIEAAAQQKNLYALIIGINNYREDVILERGVIFPRLSGCVNDANKVRDYLASFEGFNPEIKMLTDTEATKEAIVEAFRDHLGKAGKDDTILIYYSGHGTQEWADTDVWKSESDGRLECLACYYEEETKENFLLADKELRFLIRELATTDAHIVALFDCCHSGDNTRNGTFVQSAFERAVEKRIPFSFKQRPWNNFVFANKADRAFVIENSDGKVFPEGLHVQISACESDESAVEVNGEGVFTKALLGVLHKTKGDVTYQSLRSRIRQYLRNVYEQKPKIYVVNGDQSLLYSTFLNGRHKDESLVFGDVLYNRVAGWQLSLGAVHGVGESNKNLRVLDPDDPSKQCDATITKIKADISLLQLPETFAPDKGKSYQGYIENLLTTVIRVQVNNIDGAVEIQQSLLGLLTEDKKFISLVDVDPQYVVHNRNGLLYTTLPGDEYRPLSKPLPSTMEYLKVLLDFLKQMSQWEHLRSLSNKGSDSNITGNEIEVSILESRGQLIPIQDETAEIVYNKTGSDHSIKLEITIKNTTDTPLYCALLYLTSNFGAINNLLPGTVQYLEAGKSVKLQHLGNTVLPFQPNPEIQFYNWQDQIEYFKLIVNTEEFDASSLSLESLPPAPAPSGDAWRNFDSKGLLARPDTTGLHGWGTRTITLRQPNPLYNQVSEDIVEKMLLDPATADFGLGLYFEAVTETLEISYRLNNSVKSFGTKSLLSDVILKIANWHSRNKRNKAYLKVRNSFPDRLVIVSEGDSWFQHPLVVDIIDQLSRIYAVYCVAAAGDTLRNYTTNDKKNGEFYLNAIDREKPEIFLMSGGGNDILGSRFRTFLNDEFDETIEEGLNPERFLRKSIFDEIKSLADIYLGLFMSLEQSHPELHIIVHGYDYPVKLNDSQKGWLGRYMIEKNINRPRDRQAIMTYILDEFNNRLKDAAGKCANVSYLDLRGIVRYNPDEQVDQWYDEIHPDHDGFQQIAAKYIQKISELSAAKKQILTKTGATQENRFPQH